MSTALEQTRADAFGRKMVEVLNHAGLALMTSIGHRTGLFDVMARSSWATAARIAAEADLNERYVREWLGAMATGGVVEHREEDATYRLPPEHAAWLTREARPNVAVPMQFVAVLGHVEDQSAEAFRHGRGVPYSSYRRFHEVMAEESGQTVVAALFDHILPLVPGLVDRLDAGIDVLDVGCGSGRAVNALASRFPRSRFHGCDLAEQAVAAARDEAARLGLGNVRFDLKDAAEIEDRAAYDLITAFDVVHDQARPAAVLQNIARALRPDGVFLMQEISGSGHVHADLGHPLGPFLYTVSCMHCMSVSLAAGGPGLGAMWGKETALRMLREAGFGTPRVERLPHDVMNEFYIVPPPRDDDERL
jgi:2-polyprenyl-3-methyl-5-hydroxy-6-metoxy-1,4-benzoquinol methylase